MLTLLTTAAIAQDGDITYILGLENSTNRVLHDQEEWENGVLCHSSAACWANNTALIQEELDRIRTTGTSTSPPVSDSRETTLIISAQSCISINDTLTYEPAHNHIAMLTIVGEGGRWGGCIRQRSNVPLFSIGTVGGSVRNLRMSHLRLDGGTIGLKLNNVAYSLFDDVTLWRQKEWGMSITKSSVGTEFRSMHFLELSGGGAVHADLQSTVRLTDSYFGETSGSFWADNGSNLILENPTMHSVVNINDPAGVDPNWGAAAKDSLFLITRKSNLAIHGGRISTDGSLPFDSIVFGYVPGSITIDGTILRTHDVSNLVRTGSKLKYAAVHHDNPVLSIRAAEVYAKNPSFKMYNSDNLLSGFPTHEKARFEIGGTYYDSPVEPQWFDPAFEDPALENSLDLRSRRF